MILITEEIIAYNPDYEFYGQLDYELNDSLWALLYKQWHPMVDQLENELGDQIDNQMPNILI